MLMFNLAMNVLLVMALLKILDITRNPYLCTAVYLLFLLVIGLLSVPVTQFSFLGLSISGVLFFIYVWALEKIDGVSYWFVVFLGYIALSIGAIFIEAFLRSLIS